MARVAGRWGCLGGGCVGLRGVSTPRGIHDVVARLRGRVTWCGSLLRWSRVIFLCEPRCARSHRLQSASTPGSTTSVSKLTLDSPQLPVAGSSTDVTRKTMGRQTTSRKRNENRVAQPRSETDQLAPDKTVLGVRGTSIPRVQHPRDRNKPAKPSHGTPARPTTTLPNDLVHKSTATRRPTA